MGTYRTPFEAAIAHDRASITLRGWLSPRTNFDVETYRADPLLLRTIHMDVGAKLAGSPPSLLLPGVSLDDFRDALRQAGSTSGHPGARGDGGDAATPSRLAGGAAGPSGPRPPPLASPASPVFRPPSPWASPGARPPSSPAHREAGPAPSGGRALASASYGVRSYSRDVWTAQAYLPRGDMRCGAGSRVGPRLRADVLQAGAPALSIHPADSRRIPPSLPDVSPPSAPSFGRYLGAYSTREEAQVAHDRATIAFKGWQTPAATNFPIASYREDPVLRRTVRMVAGAVLRGNPPTILLPHLSVRDFVKELRRLSRAGGEGEGGAAAAGPSSPPSPHGRGQLGTPARPLAAPSASAAPNSVGDGPQRGLESADVRPPLHFDYDEEEEEEEGETAARGLTCAHGRPPEGGGDACVDRSGEDGAGPSPVPGTAGSALRRLSWAGSGGGQQQGAAAAGPQQAASRRRAPAARFRGVSDARGVITAGISAGNRPW